MTHRLHNLEIRLTNGVCIVIKYLTTREFRKHAVRRQVGGWRLVSDDGFLVATWWVGWQSDGLHEADDDGTSLQRLNTAASPLWASYLHPLASLSRWDCSALISGIDCITFFHSPVKANLPKLNWKSWKLVLQPQLFMSGNNWFHCKTWQFWSQKTQTRSCKAKLHYSGKIYFREETGIFKSRISLL